MNAVKSRGAIHLPHLQQDENKASCQQRLFDLIALLTSAHSFLVKKIYKIEDQE
jgi:fructose 1,6-bisphosphatase